MSISAQPVAAAAIADGRPDEGSTGKSPTKRRITALSDPRLVPEPR